MAPPRPGARPLDEALEELVLGAPRRYTRSQVSEAAGLDLDEARRLWRALGFPEAADGDVLFTERDLDAVRLMTRLTDAGVLEPDVREAVARAVAQSMSRLAEWQVGMLVRVIEAQHGTVTPEGAQEIAAAALPGLEELQNYVWRRHLAAAVRRMLVPVERADATGTWPLVVGFADMVGFTRATRRRSTAELGEMIERFGSTTTEVIADGHGRIVKTVGDEVLFVADAVGDGAGIALALLDRVRTEPALPDLRIGLATGPVLVRYGDVYGEVVNIAARLTAHARPGSVLVDRGMADALTGDPRYALRPLRSVAVRGYRHLHPWLLERSATAE
ncbi:adenylate/guanylate cyclase domain-containing protein [Pseudonocardia kunmingensis]|uniref:Adenylate cyclase n=1 Tax=Pseudonocardia kunmingensis TaxID=630975 RepID=A0A543D3S7_9PSEU|nr:adenylate/guanylate cyclase domain-containing protein [Pseudonocardia kunmingensis]TQM03994.1 adenylate cyclase [Pseudonocardia kunmingensis]